MDNEMKEKNISLQGGKIYFTLDPSCTYFVQSGVALVYLLPVRENNEYGRRFLIHEAQPGEVIPSFYETGFEEDFIFGLVALDSAQLIEIPDTMTEELGEEFVARAKLKQVGEEDYRELLLEVYNRNIIKEEG